MKYSIADDARTKNRDLSDDLHTTVEQAIEAVILDSKRLNIGLRIIDAAIEAYRVEVRNILSDAAAKADDYDAHVASLRQ